jgi:tetratricopeptide (TPR) repeat protein
MKIKLCVLLLGMLMTNFLIAEVDPFYIQMMEKGKAMYFQNQFEQALENFRISKFGLFPDRAFLKEIYVFEALSYFKLNQAKEVQQVLDEIRAEFGSDAITELEVQERLESDMERLLSVFNPAAKTQPDGRIPVVKKNISLMRGFETIFQNARDYIEINQYAKAEIEIKKLKRMNKKDIRIDYLQARLCFEQKKYSHCIQKLRKVYMAKSPELQDEVLYYLVISYYFTKNYGQAMAFFQKIENPSDQKKLETIIRKVRSERQRLIGELASQFTKKGFGELVNQFEGDSFIGRDLLGEALKRNPAKNPVIGEIIKICHKNPQTCEINFYLQAAGYYEKIKKIKLAIAILKKSRYYSSRNQENIDLFYKLGVLYFKMKNWQKSLVEMVKVNRIRQGYKDCDYYIKTTKKLTQGG